RYSSELATILVAHESEHRANIGRLEVADCFCHEVLDLLVALQATQPAHFCSDLGWLQAGQQRTDGGVEFLGVSVLWQAFLKRAYGAAHAQNVVMGRLAPVLAPAAFVLLGR